MPFAATWMDPEIITLREVRKRQMLYDITYTWTLKYATNEPIKETKTDSPMNRRVGAKGWRVGAESQAKSKNTGVDSLSLLQ